MTVDPTRAARGRRALEAFDLADRLSEILEDLMHMAAAEGVDFLDALEFASQRFFDDAGGIGLRAHHGIIVSFDETRGAEAFNNVYSYPLINVVLVGGETFNCERHVFAYDDSDVLVMQYRAWDEELGKAVGPRLSVPVAEIVAIHIR